MLRVSCLDFWKILSVHLKLPGDLKFFFQLEERFRIFRKKQIFYLSAEMYGSILLGPTVGIISWIETLARSLLLSLTKK